jgi:hypothetical protein
MGRIITKYLRNPLIHSNDLGSLTGILILSLKLKLERNGFKSNLMTDEYIPDPELKLISGINIQMRTRAIIIFQFLKMQHATITGNVRIRYSTRKIS